MKGGFNKLSDIGLMCETWNVEWILMEGGNKSDSGWVDDFHNREKTDTFKGKFLGSVFNVNVPGGKPYRFPYLLGRG